jgi:hypothetical protein
MATNSELAQQVESLLPTVKDASQEELFRQLGEACKAAHGYSPESEGGETVIQIGQSYFQTVLGKARDVLCDAYARKEIDNTFNDANMLGVAALLTKYAFAAVVCLLAALVLKIGVDNFCKGYVPTPAPAPAPPA